MANISVVFAKDERENFMNNKKSSSDDFLKELPNQNGQHTSKYYIEFPGLEIDPSFCNSDEELAKELRQYTKKELSETYIYECINTKIKDSKSFALLFKKYKSENFEELLSLEDDLFNLSVAIRSLQKIKDSQAEISLGWIVLNFKEKYIIYMEKRKEFPDVEMEGDYKINTLWNEISE